MRIRRKTNNCLNCKASLDSIYNYCPICGQENNNNNISFGRLISEFFSNYFSFDSRVGKTIYPLFFKPGYLTNSYNEGHRMRHMHPVRLYIVISLFYFFVFNLASQQILNEEFNDIAEEFSHGMKDASNNASKKKDSNKQISLSNQFNNQSFTQNIPNTSINIDSIVSSAINETNNNIDSITNPKSQLNDSSDIDNEVSSLNNSSSINLDNWEIVEKYLDDRKITDNMLFDSLSVDSDSRMSMRFWRQYIKIRRSDNQYLLSYVIDNLPLMMLVLLPIFALILKLLYRRSGVLYIKHLIHALHIHSFAYLIYGIAILLLLLFDNENTSDIISFISIIIVSVYAYISFLKVYKQRLFKSFVKFSLLGFIYMYFLFLSVLTEVALSLYMY